MNSNVGSATACKLSVPDTLARVGLDPASGLEARDVFRRRALHGRNEFAVGEKESLVSKFVEQFKDPLIGLLLASAFVSALMRQYDDALSITLAITIVVTVAFVQEYRSEQALEALNTLVPHHCRVLRDGQARDILASDLVPGDLVLLTVGDRVPADARVIEAADLEVDESSLTGETVPVEKGPDAVEVAGAVEVALADRRNIVHLGSLVRSGHARAVVIGTGEHSEFGAVFHMMQGVEDKKTPLQKNMDVLGRKLSIFSFAVIGFIGLVGLVQRKPMLEMFTIGVSLAVAAIPEGLPIVVTVTLALGVMRMAKRNAIVKKLPSVEALGCATVVCADKTGTLTKNEMTVTIIRAFDPRGPVDAEVTGVGYSAGGDVLVDGRRVTTASAPRIARVLEVGCVCNNAIISHEGQLVGQPTEGAILSAGMKMGVASSREGHERLHEIPFRSENKWMAVSARGPLSPSVGGKETFFVKGMTEAVLARSMSSFAGDGVPPAPLSAADRDAAMNQAGELAAQGLRVVAVAYGQDMQALTFVGFVGIMDPPRPGVAASIRRLIKNKVLVTMITGDARETACSIASSLGFFTEGTDLALSGVELDAMGTSDLAGLADRVRVFYRVSPAHKMKIVRAFQEDEHVVTMTGDGVNDAPALKMADIGVAMGRSGTDVSKEAADMILVDDDFSTILAAIEEGKSIFFNIKNFVRFQLSTSIAALALVTIATMFGLPNPLNPMQILWINIIMDGPPAQSLGVEPVDPDVMQRPARRVGDPIITGNLVLRVVSSALLIVAGTMLVFMSEMSDQVITRRDTTMTFTCFVLFDMFNALSCRSETKSVFEIGLFANRTFLFAVGGSLAGQLLVIYFPPLQEVFQTEALSAGDLVRLIALSSSVWLVNELKVLVLRYGLTDRLGMGTRRAALRAKRARRRAEDEHLAAADAAEEGASPDARLLAAERGNGVFPSPTPNRRRSEVVPPAQLGSVTSRRSATNVTGVHLV